MRNDFALLDGCSAFELDLAKTRVPIEIATDVSRRREMPIETSTSRETFRAGSSLWCFADLTLFQLRHDVVNLRMGLENTSTGHVQRGVQMTGITHDTVLIRSGMMIDTTELYRSMKLINVERERGEERERERRALNRYFRIRTQQA